MISYFALIVAWVVYFSIHSLLASALVKEFFKDKMSGQFYRLSYTVISVVGLLCLLILNGSIPSDKVFRPEGVIRYISLLVATFGVFIINAAFREYRFKAFVGLANEDDNFLSKGILNKVRHPIYSGTILIVVGFLLFNPNLPTLVSSMCIFVYLAIGIQLEERKLIKKFGTQYVEYKKRVPMLVPRIF